MPSRLKALTKGSAKVVQALNRYARDKIKKNIQQATRESCKIVLKHMRDECSSFHDPTGLMARSLGYRIKWYANKKKSVGYIGVRKGFIGTRTTTKGGKATSDPRKYLYLVIQGTKPHSLGMSRGKITYPRFVNLIHPGSKPNDFVGRAYESSIMEVKNRTRAIIQHNSEGNRWAA